MRRIGERFLESVPGRRFRPVVFLPETVVTLKNKSKVALVLPQQTSRKKLRAPAKKEDFCSQNDYPWGLDRNVLIDFLPQKFQLDAGYVQKRPTGRNL